ncbi:tyrosine integrase [Gordonia phage Salvador]|uniref:Integrase n=3 Tax=Wizardvirus TaxID=2169658 RepID=A0A514CXD8_9CAUD|nr:integrase [Gordonia phage Nubi]QDH85180.1 tyrosine integrase [Gordonia phage Nubi]UVK62369.1 tyrosine integrase [Gordonia phage Salvador]WNO27916.1 tyrosine integrase [Gordonia phage Halo3]
MRSGYETDKTRPSGNNVVNNIVHMTNMRNTGKAKFVPASWQPLIAGFLRHLRAAGQPDTTINTRRQQIERMARALEGEPSEVTRDAITDYHAAQTWALETRRGHRNAAVSFFAWAHSCGHIPENPAQHLPIVKSSVPAPRPAPDRVVNVALKTPEKRIQLMLRLSCELGLRRAEVAVVSTTDVEDGVGGAMLRVHGKGGKIRVIPISDELALRIEDGAAGHTPGAPRTGYLFPGNDGGHLSPRWVGTLCAEALPGGWTMHTLRHRFATRAYRGSRNLRAVQVLLGHASLATTQRYTAVDEDEVRAAMNSAA